MILKVARLGFPSLRTAAQPVAVDRIRSSEFQRLIDDMVETMYEYHGVGLAAPQVHLPIQLAVLEVQNHPRYPEVPPVPLTVLINPEVSILDRSTVDEFEGCLSIPELRGLVPRFKELRWAAMVSRSTLPPTIFTPASSNTRLTICRARFTSTACRTCVSSVFSTNGSASCCQKRITRNKLSSGRAQQRCAEQRP